VPYHYPSPSATPEKILVGKREAFLLQLILCEVYSSRARLEIHVIPRGCIMTGNTPEMVILHTLRSGINVAPLINVPPGKFYKKNKRTPLK